MSRQVRYNGRLLQNSDVIAESQWHFLKLLQKPIDHEHKTKAN